jgi:hypothetical protein
MKLLSVAIFAGVAGLASASVGGFCSGSPAHPCICLDNGICKRLGGTPVERYSGGTFPCPSDPGAIWGCYIYCD